MFRYAGQAGGGPLMSNVRPHTKCKAISGALRVALQCRRHPEPSVSARRLAIWLVFVATEATLRHSARCGAKGRERVNRPKSPAVRLARSGRPSAGGRLTAGCLRTKSTSSKRPHHCCNQANWPNDPIPRVAQKAGASNRTATPTPGS
jgi:hypothetical protein